MSRRMKQAAVVFVVFAVAQLMRPERANPATHVSRTTQIAPLSWLMARALAEGREAVNVGRTRGDL